MLGGALGFLIAYAASLEGTPRWVRSAFTTFSGVAANFGGIPLAFAFIATIGTLGIVTNFLRDQLHWNIYRQGFTLFSTTGIEIVYLYFQIPLMILVIAPAIDGLRREWREAASNLGASKFQYWRHVGLPILTPSLLGAVILLFGNAFAAYATAYASLGLDAARADRDRRVLQRQRPLEPASRTGARLRHVHRAGGDDDDLHPTPAALRKVDEVNAGRRFSPFALIVLVLAGAYFLVPLIATLLFSLNSNQTGKCCSLAAWGFVFHDGQFWSNLKTSFILSLETIGISLLLFVPTVYWVHLKVPRLRPVMAFLALLPFVVPPIVLVVGLLKVFRGTPTWFYDKPYGFLVAAYVILAFPYMFFALDAGFRAIDVHTLTEASHSLGAGWVRTMGKVILPNIRVAALSGSFLALAIVMGEFTIASLASFPTFPTYIESVEETQAYPAAAVSLLSFTLTWAAMLSLLFIGRGRPGRPTQLAGAR